MAMGPWAMGPGHGPWARGCTALQLSSEFLGNSHIQGLPYSSCRKRACAPSCGCGVQQTASLTLAPKLAGLLSLFLDSAQMVQTRAAAKRGLPYCCLRGVGAQT